MILTIILLLVVDICLISYFTEKEEPHPVGSVFLIAGTIALYHFLIKDLPFGEYWVYLKENLGMIFLYIFVYIILGVVWSFVRWYILLKDLQAKRERWIYKNFGAEEPDRSNIDWKFNGLAVPQAGDYKERIISWMIYFPFSIIGVMFRNWVARLYSWIYKNVSTSYDRMTKSVFK